ncbi:MAG: hypothetical protein NC131_11550 [Roseburia sp.]|nr:hypothetical protein [Roseburia sp.]
MAEYNVELYRATGLSPGNCMESIVRLSEYFIPIKVPAIWRLQDKFLSAIRVEISYEEASNIDYCVINSKGYYVVGIAMLNENVCEFSIAMDYITTVGINNFSVVAGTCTRRHVKDDTLFSNTLAEPFTPSQPLEMEYGSIIQPQGSGDDLNVVLSTVDIPSAADAAKSYEDTEYSMVVCVPQLPEPAEGTKFYFQALLYELPTATAYEYNQVKTKISEIRSIGVESAIIDSYTIPGRWLGTNTVIGSGGIISTLACYSGNHNSALNPVYGNVKNKKAVCGLFNRYHLISTSGENDQEYIPEDIVNSDNKIVWFLSADPLPDGCPICRPATWHGVSNINWFFGSCRGAKWQKAPIIYRETSGNIVATMHHNRDIRDSLFNTAKKTFNDLKGNGLGASLKNLAHQTQYNNQLLKLTSPTPAGADMVNSLYKTGAGWGVAASGAKVLATIAKNLVAGAIEIRRMNTDFKEEQNFVTPEINYPPVPSLANYKGNFFQEIRYHLSSNDLARFDDFLSSYGYAVSEPLSNDVFTGRKNHNFVEAENVEVNVSLGYGSFIERQGICEQIEAGVRIWHTSPSREKLLDNPIV